MNIQDLFSDKNLKGKAQVEILSQALMEGKISESDVLAYAASAKDSPKATCIEAMEFATRLKPDFGTQNLLAFCIGTLAHKAPRVKWESAKVLANLAGRFPRESEAAIPNLLTNSEHEGTVVRWSAATALAAIYQTKPSDSESLEAAMEAILLREEKDSIKKIYRKALGRKK